MTLRPQLVIILFVLLLGSSFSGVARGGSDPSLRWQTTIGPGFRLHFPEKEEVLAARTYGLAIQAMAELNEFFGWSPSEVLDLVILDERDSANGLTYTLPHNTIELFGYPPHVDEQLSCSEDWLQMLLIHELVHVFHLDRVLGFPKLVNAFAGKIVLPQHSWPLWFIEGLAVNLETRMTQGGRLRSPRFKMMLTTAALEGSFLNLAQLSGTPLVLPRGNASYLYGGFFLQWLLKQKDGEWLTPLLNEYSSRMTPFSFNITFRRHLGDDLVTLYDRWREEAIAEALELAEARKSEGLILGERLFFGGEHMPRPSFTPAGQLLYIHNDGHSISRLVRRAADGSEEELDKCYGGCSYPQEDSQGRRWFLSNRFVDTVYYFRELVVTGGPGDELVTEGLRCRSFGLRPGGGAACITSQSGGTQLVVLDDQAQVVQVLIEFPQGSPLVMGQPTWSPDGQTIYYVLRDGVISKIMALDIKGGREGGGGTVPRWVTSSHSWALDPVVTPDGKALIYSAAEDGVFDLFTKPLGCPGEPVRLTRVLGGAFAPTVSPAGDRLVFASYHKDGYYLHQLALEELSSCTPDTSLIEVKAAPLEPAEASISSISSPSAPYMPYKYMRPYSWLPKVVVEGAQLTSTGLELVGRDPANLHNVYLSIYNYPQADVSAGSVQWTVSTMPWNFSLGATVYKNSLVALQADRVVDYSELEYLFSGSFSAPFPGVFHSFRWTAGYSLDMFDGQLDQYVAPDPGGAEPYSPRQGALSYLTLSMAYDNTERYSWSVATERGLAASISMRAASSIWGSHWSEQRLRGSIKWFLPLWWEQNTLAITWRGGVAMGQEPFRPRFSLGGYPAQDILRDLIENTGISGSYLRGFLASSFRGDQYQYMSLDYTLPLFRVRRGVQSWPIFFKDIWTEIFVNGGYADDSFNPLEGGLGAGLEVKMSLVFGFNRSFTLTTGLAKGFGDGGGFGMYFMLGP
jgi:WD40-like Beta Propeller Repeat